MKIFITPLFIEHYYFKLGLNMDYKLSDNYYANIPTNSFQYLFLIFSSQNKEFVDSSNLYTMNCISTDLKLNSKNIFQIYFLHF